MNTENLIIGNLFSFASAICIAVSAAKKSKKDFMFWQIGDTFFGIFANIFLQAQAALIISIACLIRNLLSYQNKLTKTITCFILILSTIIGFYANNLGFIGWLPIIASGSYTLCIYLTKNEQQMRYALVINMLLWLIHNLYVQAYPAAVSNIIICCWTSYQINKSVKK